MECDLVLRRKIYRVVSQINRIVYFAWYYRMSRCDPMIYATEWSIYIYTLCKPHSCPSFSNSCLRVVHILIHILKRILQFSPFDTSGFKWMVSILLNIAQINKLKMIKSIFSSGYFGENIMFVFVFVFAYGKMAPSQKVLLSYSKSNFRRKK